MNEYQNAQENCKFLKCGLCRIYFYVGISQDIRVAVPTCTTTQSFLKIQQNSQKYTCTGVSFQPATFNFIGNETSTYIDFCEFCKNVQEHVCYRKLPANWFWFRILLKMENRHSHYDKDISRIRPLFQKTDIAREKVYLRTIDRMLTLNFNYQLFRRYFMPKVCY